MKKYVKPLMESEAFVANEYVAVCEDTTNYYHKFTCSQPSLLGNIVGGILFEESTGNDQFDHLLNTDWNEPRDKQLSSRVYTCGETHMVDASVEFIKGYYATLTSGLNVKVLIWKDPETNHFHITTALKDEIKVNKGNYS